LRCWLRRSCRFSNAASRTSAKTGDLLFTRNASVALLDRKDSSVRQLSGPVTHLPSYRFNDGACDPQGRFVTGLMDEGHSQGTGKLYRYDAALNPSVILEHINLPNGLVWSIDGTQIFFVDSGEVWHVGQRVAGLSRGGRSLSYPVANRREPSSSVRSDLIAACTSLDVVRGGETCSAPHDKRPGHGQQPRSHPHRRTALG